MLYDKINHAYRFKKIEKRGKEFTINTVIIFLSATSKVNYIVINEMANNWYIVTMIQNLFCDF